ncbi:glycosyltransferase family 2 protein [Citrobacter freundii]|uniref:glycosyltransferase family 2 protein n=1 Tax=Citrobacter freundii TaxID=546 RepID=UPI0040430668
MKVLAIVVLYNPDDSFVERIKIISKQVDKIIIYDNSDVANIVAHNHSQVHSVDNALFIANNQNMGIATALNYGAKYAVENGYDFYITFDQDTTITPDYVSRIINSYSRTDNVGVIGPIYNDINVGRESRFPIKKGPLVLRKRLSDSQGIHDVINIISSGSLYPTKVFTTAGYFIDEYFIDYVDNEFCLRLLFNGYRVCVDSTIQINHALGNRTQSSLLFKFSPTNYPYYRKYYMTRNRLYMYKAYFWKIPSFILYDIAALLFDLFRVVIFENKRQEKLKAYWRGFTDFLKGKNGELTNW